LGNYFVTNNSVRLGSRGHEVKRKYGDYYEIINTTAAA
jgi:hypothetical protein